MDAEGRMAVVRGWGAGGKRIDCFMNDEFPFGKMKRVQLVMVHITVGVLDATELHALERLRWQVHSCKSSFTSLF